MNKTKIPWCDYTINPVKGKCPMACSYCYARRLYDRFKWNPEIRYNPDAFRGLPDKPARIFIGSTIELFGEWAEREWLHMTFAKILARPWHTFIFLSKLPHNLRKWSPFPSNCGVGVTVTTNGDMTNALTNLAGIKAGYRFLSVEPFLGDLGMNDHMSMKGIIDQVIIGSQTQPTKHPKREWVESLISHADKHNVAVFVKEPLASYMNIKRVELPQ